MMAKKEKTVSLLVRDIPESVHNGFKIYCACIGKSMTEYLIAVMEDRGKKAKQALDRKK